VARLEVRAKEMDRKAKEMTITFNKLGSAVYTEKIEVGALVAVGPSVWGVEGLGSVGCNAGACPLTCSPLN
jgi:hypothetical protein